MRNIPLQSYILLVDVVIDLEKFMQDGVHGLVRMLVGRLVKRTAEKWPQHEALVQGDRRITYDEWNNNINKIANNLLDMGYDNTTSVGIFSHDCIEQLSMIIAVQKIGARAISINPRLSADNLVHLLDMADADILLYDPKELDTVEQALDSTDSLSIDRYLAIGDGRDGDDSFKFLLSNGVTTDPDRNLDPDDTGLYLHTSGTTGKPKLVSISQRSQWTNAMSCAVELDYRRGDTALHIAPIYHAAGYYNVFLPFILLGSTNIIQPNFDAEESLSLIEKESVTTFMAVRTHYKRFQETSVSDYEVSSLREILIGGTPLDPDTIEWVRNNLCDTFYNFYGLTESGTIAYGPLDENRSSPGSHIGRPFINMEVRLVRVGADIDPDDTVPQGERGQLIARGPKIMNGYYNQPAKTAESLKDGWLYTGDIAVKDENGVYHLMNRMDDLIISGGENIYPREVEKVLNQHSRIEESAVIGAEDDELGERVVAYVVRTDESVTADDIERYWLKDQQAVADYKRPRDFVFMEELPKKSHGKIRRRELAERYADQQSK